MHRLHRLTRQMCGRASLDLLQRRVLLAASGQCTRACRAWRPRPQRRFSVRAGWLRPDGLCEVKGAVGWP